MSALQNSNAILEENYVINRSLRFNATQLTYLTRTPSTASNRQSWTWSGWVKRGSLGADADIFNAGTNVSNYTSFGFTSANVFQVGQKTAGTQQLFKVSNSVFRDISAWYHIVVSMDSTNAIAEDRVITYINGIRLSSFSTNTIFAQNTNTYINNSATVHSIGQYSPTGVSQFEGCMTEINFIDGQVLDWTAFAEEDWKSGELRAKKYLGTYGTNGFYLNFYNNFSTTTLGYDSSSNGNNWSLNNFIHGNLLECSVVDVPAGNGGPSNIGNPSQASTSGNYCVLNKIATQGTGAGPFGTTSYCNSRATTSAGIGSGVYATMAVNMPATQKYYWEVTLVSGVTTAASACDIGIMARAIADGLGGVGGYTYWSSDTPTYTNGDTIGVAYDGPNSTLYFYKNGTLAKTITSVVSNYPLIPHIRDNISTSIVADFNFGQEGFIYSPPTGFVPLCSSNIPNNNLSRGDEYFSTSLYTGNGTSLDITDVKFKPSLVWLKSRSTISNHKLNDSLNGATVELEPNLTDPQNINSVGLTSFNNNGFSIGSGPTYNNAGSTFVAWSWKTQDQIAINNSGTIISQVSALPSAGFSIVSYIGNSIDGSSVGHGLGSAPKLIIIKNADTYSDWRTFYTVGDGTLDYVFINTTAAKVDSGNTLPTSNVFYLGTGTDHNGPNKYTAYCFTDISGYSFISNYVGNGNADGTYVYCGFKPKFIMVKNTAAATNWIISDFTRNGGLNPSSAELQCNTTAAESSSDVDFDILSNGFKVRNTTSSINTSGTTYIFMAFASCPFKYSNAI